MTHLLDSSDLIQMAPDELVVVQFLQGKLVVDVVLFLVCNVAIPPTAKQLFPTSVFGSWLAGRPLFVAAFSATLYLKPKHNPKKMEESTRYPRQRGG